MAGDLTGMAQSLYQLYDTLKNTESTLPSIASAVSGVAGAFASAAEAYPLVVSAGAGVSLNFLLSDSAPH